MNFEISIISFVQGVGELLPISSSVNMYIVQKIFNMSFFNFSFKIALHAGSLLALLLYFRKELSDIFIALLTSKKSIKDTYFFPLVVGTIPVTLFGYLSRDFVREFDNKSIMGILCIFFGLLLWVIDKISLIQKHEKGRSISLLKSFVIGIFQSISIFPGVSRLGICITASRMLSINRKKAIFFSLFLAIPSICGSLCLEIYSSLTKHSEGFISKNALIGMAITAIISSAVMIPCIKFMEKKGFFAIAIYRCLIGILIWKIDFLTSLF